MERLDLSLGSLAEGVRHLPKRRPLGREQEQAAAELVVEGEGQSLGAYVPSPLIPTDLRMRALAIGGAPAWSRRLKRMDTLIDNARAELEAAWRALAAARRDAPRRFAAEWREQAARYDFSAINELVRRHNLYFPAEANLAMDPRTGDYIGIGGGDYRRYPLDGAWILERFPPDLSVALS